MIQNNGTYNICCDGIPKHSVIAIGSYGNFKIVEDRKIFLEGLDLVIRRLKPSTIVIYGSAPEKYFKKYRDAGIRIVQFDSNYATSHKENIST